MPQKLMIFFLIIFLLVLGCKHNEPDEKIGEIITLKSESIQQIKLPNDLREISGLANTNDGRIFCHDDEEGVIYQIDPLTGKIIKRFQLGKLGVEADFEGLAIVDSTFYIVDSKGTLYKFREGSDLSTVKIEEQKTGFSSKFEIEGLCYNPKINSLLFACKEYPGKKLKGYRAVYAYSLDSLTLLKEPIIKIKLKTIKEELGKDDFFPSGIEYNKFTNTYFVIGSKGQQVIAEFSSEGDLIVVKGLKKKYHKQPEGITFLPDGKMIISDEGGKGSATLTIYPP